MRRKVKKVKRNNFKIYFLLIIILVIVIFLIINTFYGIEYLSNKKENLVKENNIDNIDKSKDDKNKSTKITLVMTGDALINDYLYNDAYRQANYEGYDFKPYLKYIKEYVSNYDLAYYNQETILGGQSIGLSSYPQFNSPFEVGDAMLDAGFNLVSLATNHTLDRGKKAISNSREYWNKKIKQYEDNNTSLLAVGSYTSSLEKEKLETKIYELNGITYAMLNYTYGTNGIIVPNGEEYLVNLWPYTEEYESYKEIVKEDISKIRDSVDVLIVAMHWGVEYTHTPIDIQKKTATFLAENGADIVIGTHPHVIQPVEFIGDTLVFYSQGNFISSQTSSSCTYYKCNIGLMSSLTITKTIKDNEKIITFDNIYNDLIYTYNNNYQDYLVIPFSNPEIKNYLSNYQKVYEDYAKIVQSSDSRIQLKPLGN